MSEEKINELVDLMFNFDEKELEKETDFLKEYKKLKEQNKKQKEILDKIKEIFKDYGTKEDIVEISMYRITGEEIYTILELLEEIE